ncbi:MAG: outer membrane beta-barrel protein [Chitinophagaceae bacterium]|nr:outer membrane beta-barrel protein [Chitinophagaceae bacterium]
MISFRFLFLLAIALPMGAFCQFSKGTWVPGINAAGLFFDAGTTTYTAPPPTEGYESKTNSLGFQLTPSLGYFVSSKTMIGARLIAGYQYDKYLDVSNNTTFRKKEDRVGRYGLGIFARHYFAESGTFLPYGQLNLDAGTGNTKTEGFNYTSVYRESYEGKSSGNFFSGLGLQIGVTRMLSDHVGLDISAGYSFTSEKTKTVTDTYRDVDMNGTIDEQLNSNITANTKKHGFLLSVGLSVFLSRD